MKLNLKSETLEDSFLNSHLSPSCSLPSRLPPPVPPEPQHVPPPPSPHVGPPPSIGPPTPGLGPTIGPPTPGRGPPTPLMGPSTPGVGPPTPGMGPPTPGMGPPTPGIPTPSMKPPTPAMSPLTPIMGTSTSGVGPLTPGMVNQVSSMSQQSSSHSQATNICPLTPTYVSPAQVQNLGPHTPNLGQSQGISPLTPTPIPQSPNLDHTVQNMGTQLQRIGHLTSGLQMIGNQTIRIDNSSTNLGPNTPALTSDNLDAVNITCAQGTSLGHLSQEVRGAGRSVILKQASAEEEVNRISAMLMKEAEELSCQGNTNVRENGTTNLHAGVDIVEAQGLAAGGMRQGTVPSQLAVGSMTPSTSTKAPLTTTTNVNHVNSQTVNVSQTPGSVPVQMSSMSMATLRQIQNDLLATVSESDLNAVLNATPDTPVLPNNSQCYASENNIQYSDRGTGTNESFVESSQVSNQGTIHYSNNDMLPMPVIEHFQLTNEMLANSERSQNVYSNSTSILQDQLNNSHDQLETAGQSLEFNDDKNSQCDELTRAVYSITKFCQEGNNNALESQLSLVGLLQQPALTTASSLHSNSGSSINLNTLSTPSPQGITVVIGGSHDNSSTPVSLSSLTGTLKKNPIVSPINSEFLTHLSSVNSGTSSVQGIVPVELSCQDSVQANQDPYTCQAQQPISSQAPKTPTVVTVPQQAALQSRSQIHHQPGQAQYSIQVSTQSQQTQYINNQTFSQQQPTTQIHTITQQQSSLPPPIQQQQQQSQQQQQQQQISYPSTPTPTPVAPPTPSPKKSSKKKKPGERKLLPLKDREYDAEIHCGVLIMDTGKPCTRSLTCKTHPLSLRRAVHGRSKKFDELLNEHKAAKEAQMKASKPSEAAASMVQVNIFLQNSIFLIFSNCIYLQRKCFRV